EHPRAEQGVLDLRGWDFGNSSPITLDGEWEFYPDALITHADPQRQFDGKRSFVQVPGDWSEAFPGDGHSSFGYGTYRLRILVDPLDQPYEISVPEIQTSSQVEINGQEATEFGKLAARAEDYKPMGVANYTVSYEAGNQESIELLIRAANFDNPTHGGIARSIRFGSQAAIDSEHWYSIGFQLVTFVILLLHGLYALILFVFNIRQKAFLVFFMMLVTVGISIIADHDLLLLTWFPVNYTWALKIRLLSYMWLSFFLLLMGRSFSGNTGRGKLFYAYIIVLGLYSASLVPMSAPYVYYTTDARIFAVLYIFPVVWFFCLIGRMVIHNHKDAVFLLFAAASILSSVIWGSIVHEGTSNSIYYPIDIIAAIVGFSAYWFKRYFRNTAENIKLNEQLQAANKLKDQFLANTSHELRTPLHGIINIAQTVITNEKHAIGEKSFRDMELLVTISRRMSRMLNDLLDVVRLQDKQIVIEPEPLCIQSVTSGVIDMLEFMTEGTPVRLKLDIPESMPFVLADESRLIQILFNLLHNAIKYTDEGMISITSEVIDGQAIIHVSDTGSGMDEETQERIFLPYEQGQQGTSG
ncbi:sensor histidine kinase, partial [Paenibacillus sepulcri]|nr:sensor histidine kinase [Paenibacillus sepulcri]